MSWWEMVKRHKGKLIAGSALLGGAVALGIQARNAKTIEDPHLQQGMQARRHYIFDANQSSCDDSIKDLAPSLSRILQGRFNVDAITRQLHESLLTPEKKIELWNELKVVVVGKLMALALAYSTLTLALKAQISILAAEICSGQYGQGASPSWWSWIKKQASSHWEDDKENSMQKRSNDAARQVFLRSIEFFTQVGVAQLAEKVEEVTRRHLSNVRLDSEFDSISLLALLEDVGRKVREEAPILQFVAPIHKSDASTDAVSLLLLRLANVLQSEKASTTLDKLLHFYFSSATRAQPAGLLATQLSGLASSFSRLSLTQMDSPLESSLCSSDVHLFAVYVFNQ